MLADHSWPARSSIATSSGSHSDSVVTAVWTTTALVFMSMITRWPCVQPLIIPGCLAVFATLLGWAWLKERPDGTRVLGLVLVVASLALLGLDQTSGGVWQGYAWFIVGAFMWAAFTVGTRFYGLRPLTNVAVIAVIPMLWYVPLVLAFDPTMIPVAPWHESILQLVYQGLLAGAVAPILYTRAIRTIGPQRSALVMVLVPVLTTLQAWLLLAEEPGSFTIAGIVLVLPGLALAGGAVRLRRAR